MITDLAPADTTIEVGDLVRVDGFLPWLEVVAVTPDLVITHNGIRLRILPRTVRRVRKEVR